jgi:hypothetical protein
MPPKQTPNLTNCHQSILQIDDATEFMAIMCALASAETVPDSNRQNDETVNLILLSSSLSLYLSLC